MNLIELSSLGMAGVVKLEITASDLLNVLNDVAKATANSILTKMNGDRSPEFIPRKEAMKMLNVTTALTMIRWEEKEYLIPHRIGGRIFYRKDEVVAAFERFSRNHDC